MKASNPCPYCEGTTGLPHRTDEDCFRALDREIATAVIHLRALTKRKGRLLRDRIRLKQRAIATKAQYLSDSRKGLAGVLGPRIRRPSPLGSRRFSRSK